MSNADLALMVNIRTLTNDGWTVEMEIGMRGGELCSWVTLRHNRNPKRNVRSARGDLMFALRSAMMLAGVEYWEPKCCLDSQRTSEPPSDVQRDAERYRWLRNFSHTDMCVVVTDTFKRDTMLFEKDLDDAIDAARASETKVDGANSNG